MPRWRVQHAIWSLTIMSGKQRDEFTILTPGDLVGLTGYTSAAHQVRWLASNSIPHRVRCNGTAVTTWGAVNTGLIGPPGAAKPVATGAESGPRLDLIRKTSSGHR